MDDTKKPVVIIGKGGSAREIEKSDEYDVAALNGAVCLAQRANYLFINDFSALSEITMMDMFRVKTLVMPTYLHRDTSGKKTLRWDEVGNYLNLPIELYELHTAKLRPEAIGLNKINTPNFGRIFSVGETAVAWLLWKGYRRFLTVGIDPEGGYSSIFDGGPQVEKPRSHFETNWKKIVGRVNKAEGTITRWKD